VLLPLVVPAAAGEQPAGFFGLAESLFEIEAKRQLRNDLQTLKDLLEANE
jgi:hypothetical protein